MDDQRLLSRHKPRLARRGISKPRTRGSTAGRETAARLLVFGERARREFENSSSPMRIFDHETLKYLAVNDAAVKFYGYTRKEFLALTLKDTRHPDEHAALLATLKEPAGYLRHRIPRRQIKKLGEIVVVETVIQDILFNGRKARLSLTIDVTERERAEQALRESNEFLRSVIESSRDCIKVLDLGGRLQWISAGGQRLMEIDDAKPLLQKSYLDFWSGADREAASNAVAAARAGGTSRFEGYCPTCKGTPKWWDELATPILDADGRPEKLLVASRDITERRQVERALHESESKYRNLVESSSDLIWSADAAGRITFINQAVWLIYGYESAEMLGRPVGEFFGGGHRKKSFGFFRQMLAEGRSWADYECEVRHKNGQPVVLSSNAIVLRDDEGNRIGVTGISKDITDRKRGEQERLTHAIQQRDALVREVHHRIKNSLQGVVGLLRQKIRKSPGVATEIEETIAQLQSVALVYGLQETRSDGLLSLAEITDAICSSAESLIGGCVERTFERNSQRPACVAGAEAVSVAVALNELVFNALKHQPAEAGEKRTRIVLRETADEAEIRITNRGRLPAGFDYSTGRATGNGLGLVRMLLASPGGTVTFNGAEGEVEVVLKLSPPLLAGRQQAVAG